MPLETEDFSATEKKKDLFSIIVSGDGPFPTFSRGLARAFRDDGVPSVVVPAARYFWQRRTPAEFSRHLKSRLEKHLRAHPDDNFILVGYSFGGAALPFAIRLLPPDIRKRLALVVLAAPATRADFEFNFLGWLNFSGKRSVNAVTEIDRMITEGTPTLMVYGTNDLVRARPTVSGAALKEVPGGHDLGKAYGEIAADVLRRVEAALSEARPD